LRARRVRMDRVERQRELCLRVPAPRQAGERAGHRRQQLHADRAVRLPGRGAGARPLPGTAEHRLRDLRRQQCRQLRRRHGRARAVARTALLGSADIAAARHPLSATRELRTFTWPAPTPPCAPEAPPLSVPRGTARESTSPCFRRTRRKWSCACSIRAGHRRLRGHPCLNTPTKSGTAIFPTCVRGSSTATGLPGPTDPRTATGSTRRSCFWILTRGSCT